MKVGDRVKILDGNKIDYYAHGWINNMNKCVGDVDVIESIYPDGDVRLKDHEFIWDERGLELVDDIVTIKKGDLLKACFKLQKSDKKIKELIEHVPLKSMFLPVIAIEIEKILFSSDEESED